MQREGGERGTREGNKHPNIRREMWWCDFDRRFRVEKRVFVFELTFSSFPKMFRKSSRFSRSNENA